jgi:hypothetical protein
MITKIRLKSIIHIITRTTSLFIGLLMFYIWIKTNDLSKLLFGLIFAWIAFHNVERRLM